MIWWFAAAIAAPLYVDATADFGLTHSGPSFGAAFGDADGDGDLDLWLTNHDQPPTLFIQVAPGRFEDQTAARLSEVKHYDAHGAVWLDLDADGDLDLIETVGAQQGKGEGPNRVWRNDGGRFTDVAAGSPFLFPLGSSRMAYPLDANGDGVLDVLVATLRRPDGQGMTSWFEGKGGGAYAEPVVAVDREPNVIHGLTVVDLDADGTPELVQWGKPDAVQILKRRDGQWKLDWKMKKLLATEEPGNVVLGDINMDGWLDLIVLHDAGPVAMGMRGDSELRASWGGKAEGGVGVSFHTKGAVTVSVGPEHIWRAGSLRVGKACTKVGETSWTGRAAGACKDDSRGVNVDRNADAWQVTVHSDAWMSADVRIQSTAPITQGAWNREVPSSLGATATPKVFFGNAEGRFEPAPAAWALPGPQPCAWGTLIDVDHDGDLDLYEVCAHAVGNLSNRLLLNTGAGWKRVTEHGAEGSLDGHGELVVPVDLDGDGWEELVLLNGHGGAPWDAEGPLQVFRHAGGAARSVTVELLGVPGHRSADGAVVLAQVGDRVVRRDVGLTNAWSQGPRTVRIGLGDAERVDKIEVVFPGGVRVVHRGVNAGQKVVIRAD